MSELPRWKRKNLDEPCLQAALGDIYQDGYPWETVVAALMHDADGVLEHYPKARKEWCGMSSDDRLDMINSVWGDMCP